MFRLPDTDKEFEERLDSCKLVREHITFHTLNPVIRVGMMLRELLELKDRMEGRMEGELHKIDSDGQHFGMDPKMIKSYLRVHISLLRLATPTRRRPSCYAHTTRAPAPPIPSG